MAIKKVKEHGSPRRAGYYWCYFPNFSKCIEQGYILCKVELCNIGYPILYDATEGSVYDSSAGEYVLPQISEYEKLESYSSIPKPKLKY